MSLTQPKDSGDVWTEIQSIISQHRQLTISTVTPTGWPSAHVYRYANDGFLMFVACASNCEIAKNVKHNNRTMLKFHREDSGWEKEEELSILAKSKVLDDKGDIELCRSLMHEKFAGELNDIAVRDQKLPLFLECSPVEATILRSTGGRENLETIPLDNDHKFFVFKNALVSAQ